MQVLETPFVQDFIRMADDAWKMGWHECNGGNLSYRIPEDELAQVQPSLSEGDWVELAGDVCVPSLAGEHFLITAAGSHFRNMTTYPSRCMGIIQVGPDGRTYRKCWGFDGGGAPTSELPSHLLNHVVKAKATDGANRVIYHAHPAHTIAITFALPHDGDVVTRELWSTISECKLVFPQGVGVLKFMEPGSVELGRASAEVMADRNAVIWVHHGVLCAGNTLDDAFGLMHTIEKASEILLLSRTWECP